VIKKFNTSVLHFDIPSGKSVHSDANHLFPLDM
jgi:hypothetical protein